MSKEKKGRKIGRNKKHQSTVYRAQMRKERNRKRRWVRTLKRQPANEQLYRRFETEFGTPPVDLVAKRRKRRKEKPHADVHIQLVSESGGEAAAG